MASPTFGEGWLKHPSSKKAEGPELQTPRVGNPPPCWLALIFNGLPYFKQKTGKKTILASNLNLPGLSCQH